MTMKVLVANIPLPANRFLVDLNSALECYTQLKHDYQAFWDMQGEYDVIHLHFPEYLTFELQSAYQNQLTDELIAEVEQRLKYWAARCVLVITRHVLLPHDARADTQWERLYETVYRFVNAVVHFAEPSVVEFRKRYSKTEFVAGEPRHCIIPHHNYASLPNVLDRDSARSALGIPRGASVMLVFGAVRDDAERDLIMHSFRKLKIPKKVLLVSRWREKLINVSWVRLKYWLRDLKRSYYRLHPRYNFNYGFVEEQDTQLYLNAADILFIPRLHVLNSGNITLGMTFGKVVVGPDSLDVGYLLKTTGNVVFDPDRPETAAKAVENAMNLAKEGELGPANQELALNQWSADQCAGRYYALFSELTKAQEST